MAQASRATAPADSPAGQRHLYLIDGSGFLFRAFHALPPLTRGDGTPVNAVLGFATMLMKLLNETDADHIVVVFDAGHRSFRNDMFQGYKAHRPEPPSELAPQFKLVREAARAFNVPVVEMEGFEADDIIATYALAAAANGDDVTIVSSDKDLMQLVGDGIRMLDPMKNRVIGPDEVREKFGVGPEKVIDVQALIGDSVDNVPGARNRRQDRRRIDPDLWRSRYAVGARRGDQAAETARDVDPACRAGAAQPRSGAAEEGCVRARRHR